MVERELPHLHLRGGWEAHRYTYPGQPPQTTFRLPARDRIGHAQTLRTQLDSAVTQANQELAAENAIDLSEGIQLTFESDPGFPLKVQSLEDRRSGIRLLSVKQDGDVQRAVIFVPRDKFDRFMRKVDQYETEDTQQGAPRNAPLVESIRQARLTVAQDLWTDVVRPYPTGDAEVWWEVWLHAAALGEALDALDALRERAEAAEFAVADEYLEFPERVVCLMRGAPAAWADARHILELVAELRHPPEPATPYLELAPAEQGQAVHELVGRVTPPASGAPAVCLLDTGVNHGHPLLELATAENDVQAVDPNWGGDDRSSGQHGTAMAGNCLYGCLTEPLASTSPVVLAHRLESVKILQPGVATEPHLYGAVTREAVARAEIEQPERARAICLAITADSCPGGLPTSWSAAIDSLCAGTDEGDRRLVLLAAGNLRSELFDVDYTYLQTNTSDAGVIEDPAQSWNALTVGAFTDRTSIRSPGYEGFSSVAPRGGLAASSRCSAAWQDRSEWPLKPDIVMEGGNHARDANQQLCHCSDLELLTTHVGNDGQLFSTNGDTSGATALAARLAATIQAAYPQLWPETVRGLMVHSAQWTPTMAAQIPGNTKTDAIRRIRVFGYGAPSLDRACWSARNAVTLVHQGRMQPYEMNGSGTRTRDMVLHELPWPVVALRSIDANAVMRVTLSYFVEPSPGRRGWSQNFRYASHGLRFDIRRSGEDTDAFLQRMSRAAWDEDERPEGDAAPESDGWVIGARGRTRGSVHSDWWRGPASELANRGCIAVYPVQGWWRERKHLGRVDAQARYSLIVSIETPEVDVDLYNMISTQTTVPVQAMQEIEID